MMVTESRPPRLSTHERIVLYYSARLLDFYLWMLGITALWLGLMREHAFEREALLTALLLITPLLAIITTLDAIMHALWGTTPGHRLLGISLTTKIGTPLTLPAHLRRNGAIWLQHLACFIPPFFAITLLIGYLRLKRTGSWHYDQRYGYRVVFRPISRKQTIQFCLILITATLLLLTLVAVVVRTLHRQYVVF